jgi:hypothetical protein
LNPEENETFVQNYWARRLDSLQISRDEVEEHPQENQPESDNPATNQQVVDVAEAIQSNHEPDGINEESVDSRKGKNQGEPPPTSVSKEPRDGPDEE